MAPNQVRTIVYQIIANNPIIEAIISNYANVAYTAQERNLNENTNTINLAVVSNRLTINKQIDKSVAVKGEILHYTSTISNTGTIIKTQISFKDEIPSGTTFVEDSVKIDGITKPGFNPEIGFDLPNLPVGASVIVEFNVKVN